MDNQFTVETKACGHTRLTLTEIEILQRMANGETTVEIARAMHYAPKTIKNGRAKIQSKIGARNPTESVVFAWKHGVIW